MPRYPVVYTRRYRPVLGCMVSGFLRLAALCWPLGAFRGWLAWTAEAAWLLLAIAAVAASRASDRPRPEWPGQQARQWPEGLDAWQLAPAGSPQSKRSGPVAP